MKTHFKGFDFRIMLSFGLLGGYVLMIVMFSMLRSCGSNGVTANLNHFIPSNGLKHIEFYKEIEGDTIEFQYGNDLGTMIWNENDFWQFYWDGTEGNDSLVESVYDSLYYNFVNDLARVRYVPTIKESRAYFDGGLYAYDCDSIDLFNTQLSQL